MSQLIVMALAGPALALAHDGHGLGTGPHWHATDTWGFLIAAAAVATVIWLGRRK